MTWSENTVQATTAHRHNATRIWSVPPQHVSVGGLLRSPVRPSGGRVCFPSSGSLCWRPVSLSLLSLFLGDALLELMRHESIETTRRFYVGTDAQRTNDAIWAAFLVEQERHCGGFPDISPDMALEADSSGRAPQRRSAPENKG